MSFWECVLASVQLDDPAGNLFDTIWFGWPYLWLAKRAMNPQRPLNVLWFQFTARAVATALTFLWAWLWAWPQPYVFLLGFLFLWFPPLVAMGIVQLIAERPLMAESGPPFRSNFAHLSGRFWEKRTFAPSTNICGFTH